MAVARPWKVAGISFAAFCCCLLVLFAAAYSRKRSAELRTRDWLVQLLEERFQSKVELEDFHVNVLPHMEVSGRGLSIAYAGRPEAPPMLRIEQFSFRLGFWSAFRSPHRISQVHVQRMIITIPPRKPNPASNASRPFISSLARVFAAKIVCDNAELLVFSNKPGKDPLDWEIHNVVLTEAGTGRPLSFHGTLTNATPKGEIATSGQFGPWNLDDPGATPVSGTYAFVDADLGPFPGIAGILSSRGTYQGELQRMEVDGETDTPDFSLDRVGKPVPLHTKFSATVDGINGDTLLHPVHAVLGESVIIASGGVEKVHKKGHLITLDVTTPKARIDDILKLAINSDRPFLRGPVDLKAKLSIPPGKEPVIRKIALEGSFAVTNARWTNPEVRDTLQSFSRHAEGEPEDQDAGSAVTDLKGKFALKDSVMRFEQLTFSVPGADVELAGTYNLDDDQKIDLKGHLKMQAKLSHTVTGAKSIFLKTVDPFFAKNGAGTVLPITITGTRANPVFAVSVFHKKIEKPMGNAAMK